MPDFFTVTVNGEKCSVKAGTALSELQHTALPCGGHGKCGKCKVRARGALSPLTESEKQQLSESELAAGIRLACQTVVLGDCTVSALVQNAKEEVLTNGRVRNTSGTPAFTKLGCAIDIGTTSLAAKLLAPGGETLAECGRANPQAAFGADVISRIESAMSGHSEALSEVLLSALGEMIRELCEKSGKMAEDIDGIVMTGNTAMLLLLTQTSPEPISHAPFLMPRNFGETLKASEIGLKAVSPETEIYLPPCISAFVGADTVCALLSSGLCTEKKTGMLADIGTNGEMALWDGQTLKVCSTAAGPAFEGVGISMGMCGAPGAVDRVTVVNGELFAHVIGQVPPVGICGSGLVDAVAALLETEALDETGYLDDEEAVICAPVVLTAKDIRMVQLAKSAICAGILTLLHDSDIKEADVRTLYIAGGFGNYLNMVSAGRIGLLPSALVSKVNSIGNAALGGAEMLLNDRSLRAEAAQIARNAQTVELSTSPFFSEAYMTGMLFPDSE